MDKWAASVKYTICRAILFSIASILSLFLVTFLEKMKIPGDSKGMPRERWIIVSGHVDAHLLLEVAKSIDTLHDTTKMK